MENSASELLVQLEQLKSKPSNYFLGNLLKAFRTSRIRKPSIVAKYGWMYLQSGAANSNEVWILYEQVFSAALDINDSDMALSCLKSLQTQFPNSPRVKLLYGMLHEADGEYAEALTIYDSLLLEKPSNILALKRKVCVYKAQGDIPAAVSQLNDILSVFQADTTSWLELAEIHISLSDYAAAAFCLEELVMIEPTSSAYHTRLAEVYYTIGGPISLLKARKQYVLARTMQAEEVTSLRSLYGITATCSALLNNKKHASSSEGAVTNALLEATLEQIAARAQAQVTSKTDGTPIETVLTALRTMREE